MKLDELDHTCNTKQHPMSKLDLKSLHFTPNPLPPLPPASSLHAPHHARRPHPLFLQARRLQDQSNAAAQPPPPFPFGKLDGAATAAATPAAPRTGELLVRLAEALNAVDGATPSPVAGGSGGAPPRRLALAAAAALASPETPPDEAGASRAGGSEEAAGAAAAGGRGEERQGGSVAPTPSSPMKDLVLEPPALPAAAAVAGGAGGGTAAVGSGGEAQYLDHVLEALVRARGIVLPRVRSVGFWVGFWWTVPRTVLLV